MNRYPFIAAAVACGLLMAACSNNTSSTTSASGAKTTATIGVSIQNREAQFYQQMEAGMRAEAAKYGYALNVVDANRDNARQQSQVEDFISAKVNAIVLTPYDSQAIGSAILEANRAGIPVFTADVASTSKLGTVVAHVASDNVHGGAVAAKMMCKAIGNRGTVAIIDEPEVTSMQDRVKGFRQALKADCPAAIVVSDVDAGGQRDKANSDMGDILQSHANLSGVFGANDDSALGALTAVKAAGLTGKVAVVGYDASPESRAAIKNGQMYGDVVQYPQEIGKMVIDAVHDDLNGKKPPAIVHVPVGTFVKADALKAK